MAADLRDSIFQILGRQEFIASLYMRDGGVVCGVEQACDMLFTLECTVLHALRDGDVAITSGPVLVFAGSAKAVAMAEDVVIGCIAKSTGIARAAAQAASLVKMHSGGRVRMVSGAAKKMPDKIKEQVRHAIHVGGCMGRMADGPFVYLDKNYVRMFGSVAATLDGIGHMRGFTRIIQLRGFMEPLEAETRAALERGAEILMVDTGVVEDLDMVARLAREHGKRGRVSIAFAGDVTHDRIAELCEHDVDLIDIGAAIVDAPLADCTLDVAPRPTFTESANGLELNLLQKTELRIDGITLNEANLTDIAATTAGCLSLPPDKVLVIDVRPGQIALDILIPVIRADQFFGREKMLLRELAALPGVTLRPEASIHSEGILGMIAIDEDNVPKILTKVRRMNASLQVRKQGRVRIFPTGFELVERQIEDTNTPYLVKLFSEAGFIAEAGEALPDSCDALVAALTGAAATCGIVITTGGVGAEDKDFSVEAVRRLDPQAATPYLVQFAKGGGRHAKDGIRIAVGGKDACLLIALPGPNDEVRHVAPVLLQGIKNRLDKKSLANTLAACLREKLRRANIMGNHGHTCEGASHGYE
ncbi:MAG: hypothetical protein LBB66_09920 [Desulfovibrio sp.]|jgi:molybdenum cofactor synthesis domain-containing protein|nr:hypothetical protein [Desulfovibrio sp.]